MNRTFLFLISFLIILPTFGAVDKKVLTSVVNITTNDAHGNNLGTSTGFAIQSSKEGFVEILAPYSIFKKASKADFTDSKGKRFAANRITGANDLYDIARFNAKCEIPTLSIATEKLATGSKAYILSGITNKKVPVTEVTISETSEHSGLTYYTIATKSDNGLVGSPLLNSNNEVVGVIQKSANNEPGKMYAIGIEFNEAISITTMSAADPSLNNIYIPKQIPAEEKQAASYIYLLTKNSEDTLSYLANLGDFIEEYPTKSFGYTQRMAFYVATNQFEKAETDYNKGLEVCEDKADVYYNMSDALYHLNQKKSYSPYKDWTLERALNEAELAYQNFNTPLYLTQKGKCLYALKRYNDAYETYELVNNTNFRSSENLFYQSRALEMAGGDSTKVLALLDSAVVRFKRPLREDAAPYIYYRAQRYDAYGFKREAVIGYNEYQELVGLRNLNDRFFYIKEQAEIACNFYPQALADIERAIIINPNEYVYYIEKALIETRTGNYEDAILTAKQAQRLDADDPDSYKLIGIANSELGNKAEAKKNLQKALELGDEGANDWLKNMK